MATPTLQAGGITSESIIAGYFPSGEDAHRAINALLDEGFLPSQIGAAFHSGGAAATGQTREVLGGNSIRESLGTTVSESKGSDNTVGGPASDDSAVQPAGIATGSGSPFLGVGKPGPISGSSLAHTGLPSELKHELPSGGAPSGAAPAYAATEAPAVHAGSGPQHHLEHQSGHHLAHTDESWGAKLKHLFTPSEHSTAATTDVAATAATTGNTAVTTSDSHNFGSGEGRLGITAPYGRPYLANDFERSIAGAGVAPDHSQHLSKRLSSGGAVVTVSATGRAIEVEKIFELHHGHVRFASGVFDNAPATGDSAHVEVFGHLEHIYPGLHD